MSLYQMQITDNLLLVHNLTSCKSQLWDLKLPDYNVPLLNSSNSTPVVSTQLIPHLTTQSGDPNQHLTYLSDFIHAEERRSEETYTKPVIREASGIIDPSQLHMMASGETVSFINASTSPSP
jgi:hypothetical protein